MICISTHQCQSIVVCGHVICTSVAFSRSCWIIWSAIQAPISTDKTVSRKSESMAFVRAFVWENPKPLQTEWEWKISIQPKTDNLCTRRTATFGHVNWNDRRITDDSLKCLQHSDLYNAASHYHRTLTYVDGCRPLTLMLIKCTRSHLIAALSHWSRLAFRMFGIFRTAALSLESVALFNFNGSARRADTMVHHQMANKCDGKCILIK